VRFLLPLASPIVWFILAGLAACAPSPAVKPADPPSVSTAPAPPAPPPVATASATLPEAALHIPHRGTIHVLVVFAQQADDVFRACVDTHLAPGAEGRDLSSEYDRYCAGAPANGRYQSETEDPATEWPAFRVVGGRRVQALPDWAFRVVAEPGTDPEDYPRGSASHQFWEMSRGALRVEGRVYPHLVTVRGPIPQGDLRAATREILAAMRERPAGLDYAEFDRYDNLTGRFTPDADGDGRPDGDGVLDMLVVMPRTGGGIAGLGFGGSGRTVDQIDGFTRSGGPEFLGDRRVVAAFPHGSGVYTAGFTFDRHVSQVVHEVGHHLWGSGHPCDSENAGQRGTGDLVSVMCGPRMRGMNAPDRIRMGWITPRIVRAPARDSVVTLDPDPWVADVIRVTLPDGVERPGDLLIEARTFASTWDGPSAFADGDRADTPFMGHEGLLIYQVGPPVTNPFAAHQRYSSMDNTGLPHRRALTRNVIEAALHRGEEPPRVGYGPGDAFTPRSRFAFNFQRGEADARLAVTDIRVGPAGVSFRLWGDYLTDGPDRAEGPPPPGSRGASPAGASPGPDLPRR